MYPFGRLLLRTLGARRSPPLRVLDVSVLEGRIWPQDLDFYGHVNNGRYLTLMDLGRLDLLVRIGYGPLLLGRRWFPLLGSLTIRFRKQLDLWDRYRLETRILGWDEKWFFLEQRYLCGEELRAVSQLQMVIKQGRETIAPDQVARLLGHEEGSPPLPGALRDWQAAQVELGR